MKCKCGEEIKLYQTQKGKWIGRCLNKHWQYTIINPSKKENKFIQFIKRIFK